MLMTLCWGMGPIPSLSISDSVSILIVADSGGDALHYSFTLANNRVANNGVANNGVANSGVANNDSRTAKMNARLNPYHTVIVSIPEHSTLFVKPEMCAVVDSMESPLPRNHGMNKFACYYTESATCRFRNPLKHDTVIKKRD